MSIRSLHQQHSPALRDPVWLQWLLILATVLFLTVFLICPLCIVFSYAFADGVGAYWRALTDPLTRAAIRLTILASFIAVACNTLFGVTFAWLVTAFKFRGRALLLTLMDMPLAVSPVVAGMIFVLLLGKHGMFGPLLETIGLKIIFAPPGIILCTCFITVPFVAREIIPILEERGSKEEEAALVLGASGWQTFKLVTFPAIRWGILYGVVLCNARALGEFGAVSVVSGHIRGETNTLPLHIEILYNEYQFGAAFAVSSLLAILALVTLAAKHLIEARSRAQAIRESL